MNKIYKSLPPNLKSQVSKWNYTLKGRPKVMMPPSVKMPFPGGCKGGVIISADFELGWAVRYSKEDKDPEEFAIRERKNMPGILKTLDEFNIPIVWSTVGHLFLESCNKGDHDWMRRIPHFDDHWRFTEGDWFDCDPYSNYKDTPAWYAPDLIRNIIGAKVKHEFACHTFSHIDCSYKNCPPEVLDDELKACFKLADEWDVEFKSITFPGGTAGNYETLLKYGIGICRKRYRDVELAYPFYNKQGMMVTATGPAISIGYQAWSLDYLISRYTAAIDKAIRTNTIAHFWFHPSQEEETFTQLLPSILKYCASERAQGRLWVGTMSEIKDHIDSNKIKLPII